MTRLFTGDYATGDFSQWGEITNQWVPDSSSDAGWQHPAKGVYSAQVISEDKDCGYIARYELREGDLPYWAVTGERTEVYGGSDTAALAGTTAWYALSIKFDPSFPTDHQVLGPGILIQWKDYPNSGAGPVLALGWPGPAWTASGFQAGYWYLRYSSIALSAGVYSVTDVTPLLEMPFDLGEWHDIKLQIKWAFDGTGFIRAWRNGERQTLFGDVETFTGPTLPPSGVGAQEVTGESVRMGYYRSNTMSDTGIVYHAGFRMADTEASL